MNVENIRNKREDIIDCEVKDATGLNDFQKLPNIHGISIPKVGIERFRIPLTYEHSDATLMSHDTEASMFVFLTKEKTGANMSRFCQILQEQGQANVVNHQFFQQTLLQFRTDLRDFEEEVLLPKAHLSFKFSYPLKQKSLKSQNWGWQYYECLWEGIQTDEQTLMNLTLNYEYSSTCPCSLSMSKQYEEEFRKGENTTGNGIASAHSQRSVASVSVTYDAQSDFHIERLVELIRMALPTETQSLVKRVDEQAFAILNGDNPMFVEHASRRLSMVLDDEARILNWEAKIEHIESLHSHNAVAYICKNS